MLSHCVQTAKSAIALIQLINYYHGELEWLQEDSTTYVKRRPYILSFFLPIILLCTERTRTVQYSNDFLIMHMKKGAFTSTSTGYGKHQHKHNNNSNKSGYSGGKANLSVEMMKLFVFANTVLLIVTQAWPHIQQQYIWFRQWWEESFAKEKIE
uniref:Uncharacterized protein n=1 Tax=Glossina austeni TaxID=7395 RepID=A0A1A9VVZ5_GLOAU